MGIVKDKLLQDRQGIEEEIGKFTILVEDTFDSKYLPSKVLIATDDCYFVAQIIESNGGFRLEDVTWIVDGAMEYQKKERKRMSDEFRKDLRKYRESRKSIDD